MLSSIRKQRAVLEVERRKAREATFTEPIHCSATEDPVEFDQLKLFLTQFYRTIYHRQAEIRDILEVEPHVATHYQQLVNATKQVTMEEFWQRYFYRCDVERLIQQWDRRDASARQARADAIAGSLSSVTKLAKSWSEKAVAISSNSRHGNSTTTSNNSTHGTNATTAKAKSAPVSPVSRNASTTTATTTIITAAPNNLLVAALQTKVSDVATETVPHLKAEPSDIAEPKTTEEGEEESVVFDDKSTPPRSASTTPTSPPPMLNSRILDLLQDDDDDDDDKDKIVVDTKESPAAVQGVDATNKDATAPAKPASSNAWKGLGSITVANVSNETVNASPMLTKVTSTKLTSTTSMTTTITSTTDDVPASTPPRPASSPVLFREWSRSTTPPPPSVEVLPPLPQLTPSSNAALPPPTEEMEKTGESFHGHRFTLQEKATTQLEKLESSLTAKAIVRVPTTTTTTTTNPEDDDKTKSTPSTTTTVTESSTGARPLDDVMRDWNRSSNNNNNNNNNNNSKTTITTAAVPETTTTSVTIASSNASPEVEPQLASSSEESNSVKDDPTSSTTDPVTTTTADAVAANVTITPDLDGVDDSAKVEDALPSLEKEEKQEVANLAPVEVAEALHSSAPPVVKEELADNAETAKEDETLDEVVKSDSVEKTLEDNSHIDVVQSAEKVVTSQPVAVESANSNPQDDVTSDSHEETEVLKTTEPTILNTTTSSDSSSSSDSASLAPIQPPTLDQAEESNTKDTKDETLLQFPTPPSSALPSKPTRSWFLWILAVILLACLTVGSRVAWIWATTTPNGIHFLDTLCAPVRAGTNFPLESKVSDDVEVTPVQSFEAPWWAPPAYKKVAFDYVCVSTTSGEVVPRKRIRLDWITPTRPLAQGHRKNNDQKKKKKQQAQLHRLVITSLINNKDNETVENVVYDAWLSSAVVTGTEIQTTDKRGARKMVTKLWTAEESPAISLH